MLAEVQKRVVGGITGTPERLQHRSDITTGCNRSRGLELGCNLGVEHYNNWGLYYRHGTCTTKENGVTMSKAYITTNYNEGL